MGDLSANISYKELRPSGTPDTWRPSFPLQDLMIKTLAANIQLVINSFSCHVTFSSGVRVADDYNRLVQEGYNPSPTSDHFCGNVVPVDPIKQSDIYKQFGPYYMFSTGAADTIPTVNINDFFKAAIAMNKNGVTNFGQIIHETNPEKKTEWIHLSNNLNSFFSPKVCNLIQRPQYLYTIDGGKTYQVFNG
jgi:hypothetical protein